MGASLLATLLKSLLEMDHIGTETVGDTTIYTFKTTAIAKPLAEVKAKVMSILDLPVDIPRNVEIEEVKRGPVLKEYIVKIHVPRGGMGKLTDLLAKKYTIIPFRRRIKYSGEG